jgi:hypothetical protein
MTVAANEAAIPVPSAGDMAEWDRANANAAEVQGYTLVGGKENERTLKLLEDVPFVIERVTFRPGDIIPEGQEEPRDYVSIECLVHPFHAHKFPRAHVVFNDGSTGIYRQIVKALVLRDMVSVSEELPEDGEANSTRYDTSFSNPAEGEAGHVSFELALRCPEGLRASDYKTARGTDATTWYLA